MKRIIPLFVLAIFASTLSACPPPKPVRPALNAVVDCLGENRESVDALKNELLAPVLGGGSISWSDAKQRAIQAGKDVGGCAIMELTQWFLSGTRATPEQALAAREAAESFRKEVADGATFATMCVREDGTTNACKL